MDQSLANVPSAEEVDVAFPVKEEDVKYEETMPDLIAEAEEVYATYEADSSLPASDASLEENLQVASASSAAAAANSSELSVKEGSESSPSLSDSDSESSNSSNAYYSLPLNTDRRVLSYQNIAEIPRIGDKLEMDDAAAAEERNPSYDELLRKVDLSEDNLNVANLRLEKSEEEVLWLKNEIKLRDAELEMERRRVLELESLKAELSSERKQVRELGELNSSYENRLSDRDAEVKALEVSLSSMEETYRVERSRLETSIAELESLQTSLEGKLTQSEAEKMEMKAMHDAREIQLQMEISRLKEDLENRGEQLEGLNKSFDVFKHKHDMVATEKDELNAKMDTMRAEMVHQQNQITEMEEHLRRMNLENGDLIADSESLRKLVEELEKEVDRQSGEIVAGAEGKREAIRQLCFALEHYRSGYKELRQAIVGHKRVRAVPA
ncbi:Protein NETWORKED 4A [Linum grandiflorum]